VDEQHAAVDEQHVAVDGRQIAFTQSEGRGRAVIFVHGNSSSARTWNRITARAFGRTWADFRRPSPG